MEKLTQLLASLGFTSGNGVAKVTRFVVLALLFSGVLDVNALHTVVTEGGDASIKLHALLTLLGIGAVAGTSTNKVE